MSDLADRLVGTWELVDAAIDLADGRPIRLFGSQPTCPVIYTADGHVATHIMPGGEPPPGGAPYPDPPVSIYAYCGTYTVSEDRVLHHVTVSSNPGWVGATLMRRVAFDGDDLVLTTSDNYYRAGQDGLTRLRWRRAAIGSVNGKTT